MPSGTSTSAGVRPETLDGAGREGGRVIEMQRRRLLMAFAEVLAEDGLEDAGVGRVCKRAGVSRRTFYDLFDDREGCFLAAFDAATEHISQCTAPAYTREGRWRERIRGALTALLELFEDEPPLARMCVIETLKAGPAVMEARRRALDVLVSIVEEGRCESKAAGPPPLTAQSTVGGALSVIHTHVLEGGSGLEEGSGSLMELLNPLMSMIVYPYLGPGAARRELVRPVRKPTRANRDRQPRRVQDPFRDLSIRITLRTARVLSTIGGRPGASNREIGDAAGIPDQGQISKLLRRLADYGLIENRGQGHVKGEPNAWWLTERGQAVHHAIRTPAV